MESGEIRADIDWHAAQLFSLFGLANLVIAKRRLMALDSHGKDAPASRQMPRFEPKRAAKPLGRAEMLCIVKRDERLTASTRRTSH